MQPKGSLAETDLRSLLESAQSERATGTLTVHDGDRACTLYFLFGHLFHALSDGKSGDEAVKVALQWPEGSYDFDAKAKLPPDETVRSSIPELIETADVPQPVAVHADNSHENSLGREDPMPEPVGWHTVSPETDPTPSNQTQEAAPAPEGSGNHTHDAVNWESLEAPQPRRNNRRPASRPAQEPVPVPAGTVMYDALKTSFVDFPRLITTLEKEGYTGYVRLSTESGSGLIFFREGRALECVYQGQDGTVMGRAALTHFNEQVAQGQGVLDVVTLGPELVNGLYELTIAEPIYTELYASWVNMPALLKFLEERRLTGSVTVRTEQSTGVIILTRGDLTGAYTTESRDVTREVDGVVSLGQDPNAMIEVKQATDPGSPGRLDVDEIVGRRLSGGSIPQPVAPPPAPPPPAPAQQVSAPVEEVARPPAPQFAEPTVMPPPTPAPQPAFTPEPSRSGGAVDWDQVIADLQALADESLGNRSRKVKDVLAAADRSQAGVTEAINQVPTISILFIDHSRLEALADEMRARVQSYL